MDLGNGPEYSGIELYPLRVRLQVEELIELTCVDDYLLDVYLLTRSFCFE